MELLGCDVSVECQTVDSVSGQCMASHPFQTLTPEEAPYLCQSVRGVGALCNVTNKVAGAMYKRHRRGFERWEEKFKDLGILQGDDALVFSWTLDRCFSSGCLHLHLFQG